jgi:UDP-glucuronate 4-epimerase
LSKRILVTGAAGFIGSHVCHSLLQRGDEVHGIDNLNTYYDVSLKEARLDLLRNHADFKFSKVDIASTPDVLRAFDEARPDYVVNLAAQAGVRYSLQDPYAYVGSNLSGFVNILEACRHKGVKHLVYASTSSVYGANTKMPFAVDQNVDHPLSLYAATKKANELLAHSYSHLFNLPTTGLRFFTVYGPWGRPDMAMFLFTKAILAGEPIKLFNHGHMRRDFTYIDDIVDGVIRAMDTIATPDPTWSSDAPSPASARAPWRVYNIGNHQSVAVSHVVELIEKALGKVAVREYVPMQPGDVPNTWADVRALSDATGFSPKTPVEEGIPRFVDWYREFYDV